MRLFFIFFIFFQIIYSQDYSPKKYYNPENKIETKTRDVSKLKDLFNSVLLKRSKKKEDCNCPDDKSKSNGRTNKFNLTNSINRSFSNLIRCKKQYGNLAMHINFSEYYYSVTGIYDYDSWQLSDLNIGMQYFTENVSFDMWLSAPVFNDDVQLYGFRSGLSLFPLGNRGVMRPYLGASLGFEVKYSYEYIFQNNMFLDNWYSEYYLLGRLHAGLQYMFRCRLIYKFDISYSAGSYIDRDSNQFPHYRPWVIFQSIGLRF